MPAPTTWEMPESIGDWGTRLRNPPKRSATARGARRDTDNHDDAFERRLARFEHGVSERVKDVRHRVRQAHRTVTKHRANLRKRPIRAGLGAAGRVAGVGLAGSYLAARSTVKHGRRAYKRAKPVAGHMARAVHSYATVYGSHYRNVARRKALRMAARHRVAGRKRQRYKANPLLHAAMVAGGLETTRNITIARKAAGLIAPEAKRSTRRHKRRQRTSAAGLRSHPQAAEQQENAAIKRARAVLADPRKKIPLGDTKAEDWDAVGDLVDAYPENSAPRHVLRGHKTNPLPTHRRPGASARLVGSNHRIPGGISVSDSTGSANPTTALNQAGRAVGAYLPVHWVDWMQQLRGQAGGFRQLGQSYIQLAIYLDLKARMDPRALVGFYVIGAACGQMADVFIATANQFWALYSDRLENRGRGRTMQDEGSFFGQPQ